MIASEGSNVGWSQPEIFDACKPEDTERLEEAYCDGRIHHTYNTIGTIARGLFELNNPDGTDDELEEYLNKDEFRGREYGQWVLYPWSGDLVRFPEEIDYLLMRTHRYRNLIRESQQIGLRDNHIVVGGQSVGSVVTLSLVKNLGIKEITISDSAKPKISGIGRSEVDMRDMGLPKIDSTAKRLSILDPFAIQHHLHEGLSRDVLYRLSEETQLKPTLVVDEVDDMASSAEIRDYSKRNRLPYVTVSDVDDTAVLEINRFDLDPSLPLYAGKVTQREAQALLDGAMSDGDKQDVFARTVGYSRLTPPLIESTLQIGEEIAGIPQKGSTALIAAGMVTVAVREILLGSNLATGIYSVPVGKIIGRHFTIEEWFRAAKSYYDHVRQSRSSSIGVSE